MNNETDKADDQTFMNAKRRNTDQSLVAERGKTDDSILNLRRKAEIETDSTVNQDRIQADRTRAKLRKDRDKNTVANAALLNQRIDDDKVMQSERTKIDVAIENERAKKERVLSEFLHHEREETDDSLFQERNQTDAAVKKSSQLLNDEMGLHAQTKSEVTSRDELLAIISHDLKNPIGSILSCTEILLEDPEYSNLTLELKNWIDLIKRNAETSLRLIGDLQDMERIAEGKLDLVLSENSISKTIRQSIEPFVHIASANRILLHSQLPTEDVYAAFDKSRITQVLTNLIANALKFTPEAGTVTVSVKQNDREVVVEVRDTGIGVPLRERERIFTRYAQLGKKDRRGLGLGLYISKLLIESHGGRLWVSAAPDKGSIFHFSLAIPSGEKVAAEIA